MVGGGSFPDMYHPLDLRGEMRDRKKNWDEANDSKLKGLVRDLIGTDRRIILRAKITGYWMNIQGNILAGIVLLAP